MNRLGRFYRVLLVPILFLSVFGCVAGGPQKPGSSQLSRLTATPEQEARFREAEKIYQSRKFDEAEAAFQSYIQEFPYNALTPKSYFYLGEIAFLQKDYVKAISHYKRARQKGLHPEWGVYCVYKQAVAHFHLEEFSRVFDTLDRIPPKNADRKTALRAASLRVTAAKKNENGLEEKKGYLEVIDAYEGLLSQESKVGDMNWLVREKTARDEVRAWVAVEETEGEASETSDWLKRLWPRFENKTSGGYLTWKLAKLYHQKGDYAQAAEWARRYAHGYPKGEYALQARALLTELGKRDGEIEVASGDQRGAVGILLPLTGKYAVYGESVLHGLECAAGVFAPCRGDLGLNLVIRDTEGDPKKSAEIVSELASNPSVRAIIGPLPQVEVSQATQIAESKRIPMISLSQKADVASQGSFIFRNFLTVADQVATLVDYACSHKKWKKYAILYPSSAAGQEYKNLFEQELNRCGGQLVAQASYSSGAKNFESVVKQLQTSDFDALFIPDVYRVVPDIVSALEGAGIENVNLLGGAGWGQAGLLEDNVAAIEGAAYVNGFFAKSFNFSVRDFVATFQSAYGFEPTLLEAYAFDTMRLLGEVLRDHPTSSREELQQVLASKRNFPGVTGDISFDEQGDARRRLTVLTVENGQVREVR